MAAISGRMRSGPVCEHDFRKCVNCGAVGFSNPPKSTPLNKANDELDENTQLSVREWLERVRDAGALDDNNGGEDWRHSDSVINEVRALITSLINEAVVAELDNLMDIADWHHSDKNQETDMYVSLTQLENRKEHLATLTKGAKDEEE